MILHREGTTISPGLVDPEAGIPYSFIPENEAFRAEITELEWVGPEASAFRLRQVPLRPLPARDEPFERTWAAYRAGRIYHE